MQFVRNILVTLVCNNLVNSIFLSITHKKLARRIKASGEFCNPVTKIILPRIDKRECPARKLEKQFIRFSTYRKMNKHTLLFSRCDDNIQQQTRCQSDTKVAIRDPNGPHHSISAEIRHGDVPMRGQKFPRRGREQYSIIRWVHIAFSTVIKRSYPASS